MTSGESLGAPFGPQTVADDLYEQLTPMFSLSELSIPEPLVMPTTDPLYVDRFPAAFEADSSGALRIYYHPQALAELSDSYDHDSPDLLGTLERVYLAGGMVTGAVFNQVSLLDSEGLNYLYDTLQDVDPICDLIRATRGVDADQKTVQMTGLMQSDAQRKVAIGLQRLCIGVYSLLHGESDSFDTLQHYASEDMERGIRDYRNSLTIFRAGRMNEIDAELKAGQRFRDAVTEMTWALCYPMTPEEIRRIFNLCHVDESVVQEQQVLDRRELDGRGFIIDQ